MTGIKLSSTSKSISIQPAILGLKERKDNLLFEMIINERIYFKINRFNKIAPNDHMYSVVSRKTYLHGFDMR